LAAAITVAVCVALGTLAYSFYETYGPNRGEAFFSSRVLRELGLSALPFTLVAAALIAGGGAAVMKLAISPVHKVRVLPLAGLALLLTVLITLAGAWLGTVSKQAGQERAAVACSPDDRAALRSLGTLPEDGEYGRGMQDGTCRGSISLAAGDQTGLERFRVTLGADGWVPEAGQDNQPTRYTRSGKTLDVSVEQNKAIEITLSLP
jgi:hypothetical protein